MSARLETLHERLTTVRSAISEAAERGQRDEELIREEADLVVQIAAARSLLVEGSSKSILRG